MPNNSSQSDYQILRIAYQQLKLEKDRCQSLLRLSPDGHLVTDSSGTIIMANAAMVLLLNVPEQFIAEKSLLSFLPGKSRAFAHSKLAQIAALQGANQGSALQFELTFSPRGGLPFRAAVAVSTMEVLNHSRHELNLL